MELSVGRRRVLGVLLLLAVAAALLAVPAQGYLAQRGEVTAREAELAELDRRNEQLDQHLERLGEPEEIQRLARRDYGLVEPGEESYSLLPPSTAGLHLPRGWPFDRLAGPLERAATGGA